ncbi:MAG: hypothetical protein V4580_18085 [Bacteroidota bacterium]
MALDVNIFYSHNLDERFKIISEKGEFLSRIKYYGFYINLYALDHTFVEVYYNWYSNKLEEIELLEPTDERLHLFAAFVDLSDIHKK